MSRNDFSLQFRQGPAQELLFGGAGLDPAKLDRLEAIDHVDRRIIARQVAGRPAARSTGGGASKSPLRVSES